MKKADEQTRTITKFFFSFLIYELKKTSKGTYAQLLIETSEWWDYGNFKIFFLLFI